jgi:hypothetical protein
MMSRTDSKWIDYQLIDASLRLHSSQNLHRLLINQNNKQEVQGQLGREITNDIRYNKIGMILP